MGEQFHPNSIRPEVNKIPGKTIAPINKSVNDELEEIKNFQKEINDLIKEKKQIMIDISNSIGRAEYKKPQIDKAKTSETIFNVLVSDTYTDKYFKKYKDYDVKIINNSDDFSEAIYNYLSIKRLTEENNLFVDSGEPKELINLTIEVDNLNKSNLKEILGSNIIKDLDKIYDFIKKYYYDNNSVKADYDNIAKIDMGNFKKTNNIDVDEAKQKVLLVLEGLKYSNK